jgi:hypothetical protein
MASNGARVRISAAVLTLILLVIAGLLFLGIFLALPAEQHFSALLFIGGLSLLFALLSYFAQGFAREPVVQRSLTWGFLGMGFATLFLTVSFAQNPEVAFFPWRFGGLILLMILLAGVIGFAAWRARTLGEEHSRLRSRQSWDSRPAPSAFDYPAAKGAPVSSPSDVPSSPPPPGGGA